MTATHAIVQTGRLGDLWFTVPLADHLSKTGNRVEIWYDELYGNPFSYFPSVLPRPMRLARPFAAGTRLATVSNSVTQQLTLYLRTRLLGRAVIWNQIYPLRIGAYLANEPYPQYWYRRYPGVNFRRATSTLPVSNEKTILYFAASLSLGIGANSPYATWLETNLAVLARQTGYHILYVPPLDAPDHARFETWRGDLEAYQRLIARCGIVYGIVTSAHVLGQLLGKCVIPCYVNRRRIIDTIGGECIRLFPGDLLDVGVVERSIAHEALA